MDLQEEYFQRKKVPACMIKYVDRATLILKSKSESDYNWIHVSIDIKQEANHPAYYMFLVSGNPIIYASPDFNQFAFHHNKIINEQRWEWDQYESSLLKWVQENTKDLIAIPSSEAVFSTWEMFLANYDSWFANFMPFRIMDLLAGSLVGDTNERLGNIKLVENWLAQKYERVYSCWRNIRVQLDQKNYADWLANVINSQNS